MMSKLVVFDIDGTLTNTYYGDDMCFFDAMNEVLQTNVRQLNWQSCPHRTDSAYIDFIFRLAIDRPPYQNELEKVQQLFHQKLQTKYLERPELFEAVPGAAGFFHHLKNRSDVHLGIATGGWKFAGAFKLDIIELDYSNVPFHGSDTHYSKEHFTREVIQDACKQANVSSFNEVYYIGDRDYDLLAAQKLGAHFIGMGTRHKQELIDNGVEWIVDDYTDYSPILEWLSLPQ